MSIGPEQRQTPSGSLVIQCACHLCFACNTNTYALCTYLLPDTFTYPDCVTFLRLVSTILTYLHPGTIKIDDDFSCTYTNILNGCKCELTIKSPTNICGKHKISLRLTDFGFQIIKSRPRTLLTNTKNEHHTPKNKEKFIQKKKSVLQVA